MIKNVYNKIMYYLYAKQDLASSKTWNKYGLALLLVNADPTPNQKIFGIDYILMVGYKDLKIWGKISLQEYAYLSQKKLFDSIKIIFIYSNEY